MSKSKTPVDFYLTKLELLTKLRDALQFAVNDLHQLRLHESTAPGGDHEEIDSIGEHVSSARRETSGQLSAVQAMIDMYVSPSNG